MDLQIPQTLLTLGFIVLNLVNLAHSGALQLTSTNFDSTLANHELVIINFYADWCRFSNILAPIFDDAAEKVAAEFKSTPGRVVLGKVDCDNENTIATRFHVTKYPTLKVIRNGQPAKKEYRGQRSADAFLTFVRDQLEDPITEFHSLVDLNNLDTKKGQVIGYFDSKDQVQYDVFRRVASMLKDDCKFYAAFGEAVRSMHPPGEPIIVFRPDVTTPLEEHETYRGNLSAYDETKVWTADKCVPLVREITFENAEELTEEGLPFLILFYAPGDTETIKLFKSIVSEQLLGEKQNINFLTADGERFAHPLHHLGKSKADLPLIAIDSFRHMYIFPDTRRMGVPGALKQFIQDLYSGKLHREFHYGPETESMLELEDVGIGVLKQFIQDLYSGKLHREFHYGPETESMLELEDVGIGVLKQFIQDLYSGKLHREFHYGPETESMLEAGGGPISPPESTFNKLAPSRNRYTLLKDEL
ncbi:hypothetical protein M8J75_000524 [Diaphorina citri]|nr:hypothetical protein M8J75_000524 [Diaphorina citri]KAI5694528.1 hypothetical protein M8J75_000524 [Diaphorina citri]